MSSSRRAPDPKPQDLARATPAAPRALSTEERKLVAEAVRLGQALHDQMQVAIRDYGAWLVERVFEGDAAAALHAAGRDPVWVELARRAGTRALALPPATLYLALRVAAYDARIRSAAWRDLELGRKALLLPLADDELLVLGAETALRDELTHAEVKAWVTAQLAARGRPRRVRVHPAALRRRLAAMTQTISRPALVRRFDAIRNEMRPAERQALADEVEALRTALARLAKSLRGR